MKTLLMLTLTLVLTASLLMGCGCTNQKMDSTTAPTVLPTNEEIWNSTESTTRNTTEAATNPTIVTETTEATGNINETEVKNGVNAHTEMMDKIQEQEKNKKTATSATTNTESPISRMMPKNR